ncbi:MAG TPA: hypothetical protein VGX68_28185 [Thermoanaerobaculia bacterium]|jgi:hypothetical protein|nr:hypothetical protein [Thermoanaerobaculia bacterium]
MNTKIRVSLIFLVAIVLVAGAAFAAGKNGTTLAAVKTIEICDAGDGNWVYSGEVAVWNEGVIATSGFAIQDCIQNKVGSGQFGDVYCNNLTVTEIPPGTTQLTALTFPYSFTAPALTGDIRNIARCTILNHSGHITNPPTPFGPEPKATWFGGTPAPCQVACGCTLTQGYWGTHPSQVPGDWPAGYLPSDTFYLSGTTWQGVLDTAPKGNGYYILAVQFIAATLNTANNACVPSGVQDIIDQAAAWLALNDPSACAAKGSCGTQKDWGAILDDYNNGVYPGGPAHCG